MTPQIWFAYASFILIILSIGRQKFNRHALRVKQSKRCLDRLKEIQHPGAKIEYLRKINAYTFEEIILTAIERNKNAKIKRNKRYTGDGGIDGRFWINKELYIIQAKRYANEIQLQHVKEFSRKVEQANCKGIFVHTGRTPESAWRQIQSNSHIEIISGSRLIDLLENGYWSGD